MGDVAEQIRGVTFAKADAISEPEPGRTAILRAGNITDRGLALRDLVYVPSTRVAERQRLRPGDIVIATSSGSLSVVGKASRVEAPIDAAFGAFLKVLRPRQDRIDPSYFAHYFQTPAYRHRVSAAAAGASINNLRTADLDEVELPLPPLDEQRRIARILDAADDLRVRRRRSINALGQLGEAIVPTSPPTQAQLGDLLDRIESGRSPVCETRPAESGEWGVLKLGAVSSSEYRPSENKAMLSAEVPDHDLVVAAGDILLARKNTLELVGTSVFVSSTPPRLLLPDLIFRLVPRTDAPVTARYLQAALAQPEVRHQIRRLAGGSAGSMPNISKTRLLTVSIGVPPLEVQKRFDEASEAAGRRLRDAREHLAQLDALFASLQQRAFAGEL
ncbi:restriction endonuclease subunit S [Patulibacter brassicae]|uniref:Restriction endonuclease subunit S n=1 Tax=Patulibacter brassicae TaxID=1705717 RepID=A0ABU4VH81_9ACTN|nr:restriction endonuclease subunit S [Patulibacter brassicae]MDX8150499.1 restriction endonuclease subunit S [Patulibacter brassicae]